MKNYFYKIYFTLIFFWLLDHAKYTFISKNYTGKQEKYSLGFLTFVCFLFSPLQKFAIFCGHLPKLSQEQTFLKTIFCIISGSALFQEKLPRSIIQLYSIYYISFIIQIHILKDLQWPWENCSTLILWFFKLTD